jgi:hypothetical protein
MQFEIETLKKRLSQAESFIRWENKLFATPSDKLSDAQKVLARLIPSVENRARNRETTDTTRDDGLTRVYRDEFAKGSGKSPDRVGATLKQLNEVGLVRYKVESEYDRQSKAAKKVSYLSSTDSLKSVNVQDAERNRGNGQKSFVCKSCHSANTVAKRVYQVICKDCGEVHIYDATKVEDRAFMNVGEDTIEHWQEFYGNPLEETEPTVQLVPVGNSPARPCLICGVQAWEWNPNKNNWECSNLEGHQE